MRTLSAVLVLAAASAFTPAEAGVGSPLPELEATKWYNSPPLTLEDLHGKAVLIEVFRTW